VAWGLRAEWKLTLCPGTEKSRHASTNTATLAYRNDDGRLKREISTAEFGKKRDQEKIKGVAEEMISPGEPPLPPPLPLAGARGGQQETRGEKGNDRQQSQRRQQHDVCSSRSPRMSLCVLLLALVLLVLLPFPTHAGLLKVRTHMPFPSYPTSFPISCSFSVLPQVLTLLLPPSLPLSLPPSLSRSAALYPGTSPYPISAPSAGQACVNS